MTGFRRGNSSSVPLRFYIDLLPLEGGALVEREQLEEQLDLQPAAVQAERLEQHEQHDDDAVDRALQAVGGGKRGDTVLDMRGALVAGAEGRGNAGDDTGHVVLE